MSAVSDFYTNPDLKDGFGSELYPRMNPHRGLDFPKALGTPVPAVVGGTVVTSTWDSGLGNVIEIHGDDGMYWGYRHLRSAGYRAVVGQRVEANETIAEVSDTGSLAYGYHLCITYASGKGGVYGDPRIVNDPWPAIVNAINGTPTPGGSGYRVGPIIRSGDDWALRLPVGELAQRVAKGLIKRKRLPEDYLNDGDPGPVFEKAVQMTLNVSGAFIGDEDGRIERGGCGGIQLYAAWFGGYSERGGIQDRRPEVLSWECFAIGLETD